jgi:hypothetical protein
MAIPRSVEEQGEIEISAEARKAALPDSNAEDDACD